MMKEQQLTKRERKILAKQQKKEEEERKRQRGKLVDNAVKLFIAALVIGGILWVVRELTKSIPGIAVEDQGRSHTTGISTFEYNSNPPTSGDHFPVWAKRGLYDRVISDGHLIHSMEHGYVVVSYNCGREVSQAPQVPEVYAQEEEGEEATDSAEFKPLTRMNVVHTAGRSFFTPEDAPPEEVSLPESFQNEGCKKMVEQLSGLLGSFDRLIIVPRPGMEARVAVTAWNRIDKMEEFDMGRIRNFVSAWHNKGPEKTVE